MVSPTRRAAGLASTAGAFVAAGVAARVASTRQRSRRRARRREQVEFGSVHGPVHTVTASDGVRLNVEVDDGPTGGPTLVFLHGWVCTLDTWHYQRLALRGEHRMVFMDHRSHGGSGYSDPQHATFEQLADDLFRVVTEMVPTGPIVLVGHSMGGMAVQQLAADHPELFGDRVVGVALLGTSSGKLMRGSAALKRLTPLLRLSGAALDWGRTFNSYTVIRRWAFGPNPQERHVDMVDEMILRAPTSVLLDFYSAFSTLDLSTGLKGLGEASTVVVGGTKDLLTPIQHSRRLVKAVPDSRLVELEDVGHMVMFEAHEEVTDIVAELVQAVR